MRGKTPQVIPIFASVDIEFAKLQSLNLQLLLTWGENWKLRLGIPSEIFQERGPKNIWGFGVDIDNPQTLYSSGAYVCVAILAT
jgi:hypothetical protein